MPFRGCPPAFLLPAFLLGAPSAEPTPPVGGPAAILTLRSAKVLPDGRLLQLVFKVSPPPAADGMPDPEQGRATAATPTLSGGAALEPIGSWSEAAEYPVPSFSSPFAATRGGALPAGRYDVAYTVKGRSGKVEGRSPTASITIKAGDVPKLNFVGGFSLPPGLTADVYLSKPGGAASTLSLYKADLTPKDTGPRNGIPLDVNAWEDGSRGFPDGGTLTWTSCYLITDPAKTITFGKQGLKVSGPAGLLQDRHGNATAAFSDVPVENLSLAGSDGFTSDEIRRGKGGVTLHVSSSHGSETGAGHGGAADFLAGQTPRRPLKTVARAVSLMASNGQHGKGGAVRLLRGDVFVNPGVQIKTSGQDFAHPFVIEDYWNPAYGKDPGTRPVLASEHVSALATSGGGGSPRPIGDLLVRRIHLKQTDREDPKGAIGVNLTLAGGGAVTFDDCVVERFSVGVNIEPASGDYYRGVTLTRCVIRDSFSPARSHSQGLYVAGAKGLLLSQCVFDTNGRKTADLTASDIFSHNVYLQFINYPAIVWGNLFRNGGSHGLQGRAGGVVAYNVFSGNPIAAFLDYPGGVFHKNVVEKARDILNPDSTVAPRGFGLLVSAQSGASIYAGAGQAGQVVESNILVNSVGRDPRAIEFVQNDRTPIRDVIVRDNTVFAAGRGVLLEGKPPGQTDSTRVRISRNAIWTNRQTIYEIQYAPADWSWYSADENVLGSALAKPFSVPGGAGAVSPTAWRATTAGSETSSKVTATPWPVATADLGTFHESVGGKKGEADYVTLVRDRPPKKWGDAYMMTKVHAHFEAKYKPGRVPPPRNGAVKAR